VLSVGDEIAIEQSDSLITSEKLNRGWRIVRKSVKAIKLRFSLSDLGKRKTFSFLPAKRKRNYISVRSFVGEVSEEFNLMMEIDFDGSLLFLLRRKFGVRSFKTL
jgi:hypothetical protein